MQMAFLRQRLGSAPPAHPSALAGEHASRTALGAPSTAWPGWAPQGWGRVRPSGVMSGEGIGKSRLGNAGGRTFLEQLL